jgi:V/A-type H+-transporting ATPase subunit C
MPESISAYINAYARGLKSRLLTRGEIESMLETGRLETMGETLLKSQYEVEMAEALSRYHGVDAIEDAVSRNLVNTFARLRAMCREETARLADIFISRWDLIAVKALLRNRHQGLDAQSGAASLVPGPSMPQPVQNELAGQDTMDLLVRGLAAWDPGLCGGLPEALPAYQETKDLRALEEALDRTYFARSLVRLGSSRSKDARFVQDLLRAEIDRINLRRLFEPRAPGVEPEDVLREMLPRGRLSHDTLREIASAGSPERAAEVVGRTVYGDMAEALSVFAQTGKFSALERQFESKFLDRLRGAVQRQGVGLASLLRYAWLKYNEVMNLRIIAHGVAARLPKARLEQEMLYV